MDCTDRIYHLAYTSHTPLPSASTAFSQHCLQSHIRAPPAPGVAAVYASQLEPLLEPWDASFYAVSPPGLRVVSGKMYSSRLLHINMTTAFQR